MISLKIFTKAGFALSLMLLAVFPLVLHAKTFDKVAAKVNAEIITLSSVEERGELLQKKYEQSSASISEDELLKEALNMIIEEKLQTESGCYWLERLEAAGLPCGPINTFDKVVQDPQVRARDMVIEVEHPVAGAVKMMGIPIKFSATPAGVDAPPPGLGEHNSEILGTVGYSSADIAALREEGVI